MLYIIKFYITIKTGLKANQRYKLIRKSTINNQYIVQNRSISFKMFIFKTVTSVFCLQHKYSYVPSANQYERQYGAPDRQEINSLQLKH